MALLLRVIAFGVVCWLSATQDLLSCVENGDIDDEVAVQRYHGVGRFASILSSAPVLAEDGVPLDGIGSVKGAEEILNEILGVVDVVPPTGWQQVVMTGVVASAFEQIGILSRGFPVIKAIATVPTSSIDIGRTITKGSRTAAVDCSGSGATWLDPSLRMSAAMPYFTYDQCATLTAQAFNCENVLRSSADCHIRFALGADGNCMPCKPLAPGSTDTVPNTPSGVEEATVSIALATFGGEARIRSTAQTVEVTASGDLRLGHFFDYQRLHCGAVAQRASAPYVLYEPKDGGGVSSCLASLKTRFQLKLRVTPGRLMSGFSLSKAWLLSLICQRLNQNYLGSRILAALFGVEPHIAHLRWWALSRKRNVRAWWDQTWLLRHSPFRANASGHQDCSWMTPFVRCRCRFSRKWDMLVPSPAIWG